jgi:hypothetical protein
MADIFKCIRGVLSYHINMILYSIKVPAMSSSTSSPPGCSSKNLLASYTNQVNNQCATNHYLYRGWLHKDPSYQHVLKPIH